MAKAHPFEPARLGKLPVKNRIVRTATYEGMCDPGGKPGETYREFYASLAANEIGTIITGFAFVSAEGRSMQPCQAGVHTDLFIPRYTAMTDQVHRGGARILMQIAHAGRQTRPEATGEKVVGVTRRKSKYFGATPHALTTDETLSVADQFATAAHRAQRAGFDGVQIHAAHGYLVHQFLLPSINTRTDRFGIDSTTRVGTAFLKEVIERTRYRCGKDFPIFVKVSAADDYRNQFSRGQFIELIRFLDAEQVDGIEISYGTMDHALNIFRGYNIPIDLVLDYNPRYKCNGTLKKKVWKSVVFPLVSSRIRRFSHMYNLPYARLAKEHTSIPVISVGGFRRGKDVYRAIEEQSTDFVGLCRPFVAEPDFAVRLAENQGYVSKCVSCNRCSVLCDSGRMTMCTGKGMHEQR